MSVWSLMKIIVCWSPSICVKEGWVCYYVLGTLLLCSSISPLSPRCPPLLWLCMCPHRVDGVMRTMNTEKLLKTIPIIQNQMDALLDFNVSLRWSLPQLCSSRSKKLVWIVQIAAEATANKVELHYLSSHTQALFFYVNCEEAVR